MCRIWCSSLADYNAGILHGDWVDVTDPDTVREAINAMLAASPTARAEGLPAEEWAIFDSEGFGDIHVSESEDLDTLCQIAEAIDEHGEPYLAWAGYDSSRREDVDGFKDAYLGEWDSLADYVEDYWEQSGCMPEAPKNCWWHPCRYCDWERMARDLEYSGDVFTVENGGKVFVFSNH